MKRNYMKQLLISMLILSFAAMSHGQEAADDSLCVDRRDLLQMIHAPVSDPNNTTLMDLMDAKGFQLGSNTMQRHDTVDGIPLSYRCQVWYANASGQMIPAVYVCESEQGLSNMIILNLDYSRECTMALTNAFHESGYMYDGRRNVYTGRDAWEKHSGLYEAEYAETDKDRLLTMRFQSEIATYVKKQAEYRKKVVEEKLNRADQLVSLHKFQAAITTLDTLFRWYEPMDDDLYNKLMYIKREQVTYYKQELTRSVNEQGDMHAGIAWCDSLAAVDASDDSILLVRQVLEDQANNIYPKYSTFMPISYRTVVTRLEDIINKEIRANRTTKAQSLNFEFTFLTTWENRSHGNIQVNVERGFLQSRSKERNRNSILQSLVDSLAALPVIQPVYRYGININTSERLAGRIDWVLSELKIDGSADVRPDMKMYVDTIEARYFTNNDPTAVGKNRMKLPYRRDYTFGITRKQYAGNTYTDVSLLGFKTSGPLSWMPSLIIPGLGTKNQGRISSAAARAIPFFIFGGLSAAGFVLKGKDYERNPWGTGSFWTFEHFDEILAYGGMAIAGTIYLTDLVQSIKATIVNRSRSKKLRNDLKNNVIDVRMDEIHIK